MPPEMAFYRKVEALAEPRPLKEYHVVCVCLRASTPVVENDQDIGESNASVTINIGGTVVGHWFTVIARSKLSPSATEFGAIRFAVAGAARGDTA